MKKLNVCLRQIILHFCLVLLAILSVQLSVALAEDGGLRMNSVPRESPKIAPGLPPGFFSPDELLPPELWDPGVPGQCNVVYSASTAGAIPYRIQGGGNAVVGDMNYLFYFPVENVVLGFIDPRLTRVYPKGVLDGRYGISVNFQYSGGFPPGFQQLGGLDQLGGTPTYPIPGDRFSRVVVSKWPFIRRSPTLFDYPKHCRFNKDCFCLRKS